MASPARALNEKLIVSKEENKVVDFMFFPYSLINCLYVYTQT
jgi:hypothetical protein